MAAMGTEATHPQAKRIPAAKAVAPPENPANRAPRGGAADRGHRLYVYLDYKASSGQCQGKLRHFLIFQLPAQPGFYWVFQGLTCQILVVSGL
jgi:hypothetical protein